MGRYLATDDFSCGSVLASWVAADKHAVHGNMFQGMSVCVCLLGFSCKVDSKQHSNLTVLDSHGGSSIKYCYGGLIHDFSLSA